MNINIPISSPEISMAWKTFIDKRNPGNYLVSKNILDSWTRCINSGVDPYDGVSHDILTDIELDELLIRHRNFIEVARPF
ncbi:MAG TPA: hypothetical protein PKI17_06250, partial [Syntrophomonas sp.]|nr:hypothetical protein [Syntrophomonas sp.]